MQILEKTAQKTHGASVKKGRTDITADGVFD
jgi:predicted small metal-binding protein